MPEPTEGRPWATPWDRRPRPVPPWPPGVLALREPRRPELPPGQRAAIVSPFMERLRTPQAGAASRVWHFWDVMEVLSGRVLGNWMLRTMLFALVGYWIGLELQAVTGPFVSRAGERVLLTVSAPVTGAIWGAIFGLSASLFFRLVMAQAWEWVAVLVVLGSGVCTAAAMLAGRVVNAISQLTF
jgi:hypothetical protein